jgi:hypothetical protein
MAAFIMLAAGIILYAVSLSAVPAEETLNPPEGYTQVFRQEVAGEYINKSIYTFTLEQPQEVGIYIWSSSSSSKTIKLTGTNLNEVILLAKDTSFSQTTMELGNGTYEIVLTKDSPSDTLYIYMGSDKND